MFKNLYIKFFLLFLIFGIIISTFIFIINGEILDKTSKRITKLNAESFYKIHEKLLRNNIYEAKISLNFISENNLFQAYINNDSNDEDIKNLFLSLVDINHEILQIRYLNEEGIEEIKLTHYQNSLPKFVKKSHLQDKSDRYYFIKTKELKNKDDFFISNLDLNKEFEIIEKPYQPTIRVAKNVFNKDGTYKGIIILNFNMKRYIELFNNSSAFNLYLVDKDGNFLIHTNKEKSWSKELNNNYKLQNEINENKVNLDNVFTYNFENILKNDQQLSLILFPKDHLINELVEETNLTLMYFLIPLMVIFGLVLSIYPAKTRGDLIEEAKKSERNYKLLNLYVPMSTTNEKGVITYVNRAFEDLTGYPKDELIGKTHTKLKSGNIDESIYRNLWNTISKNQIWRGELENIKKNGQTYWIEMLIEPSKNEETKEKEFISICHNITDKKLIENLAKTDHLTNISNRSRLDEELSEALYSVKRYHSDISVMLLDIDYFKQVNDNFGHNIGDSVLIEFSQILKNIIRKTDVLGRWGGEEFLIISPNTKELDMCAFAEKVRKAVSEFEFKVVSHKTVSIGFTQIKESDVNIHEVINRADEALYKAKAQGRDMVCNERFCNTDLKKQTIINYSI